MTEMVYINGALLLPAPSVLKKIARLDADAPTRIMDMMEARAAARQAEERAAIERAAVTGAHTIWAKWTKAVHALKHVWSGAAQLPAPSARVQYVVDGVNQSFAIVGDDLRYAIRAYMADVGLTAAALGLTRKEEQSLQDVAPLLAPYAAGQGTRFTASSLHVGAQAPRATPPS